MTKIRLWKLGHFDKNHPENTFLPSEEGYKKLESILSSIKKEDKTVDIIWNPLIDVIELTTGPDGVVLNDKDFIVSAKELEDAIEIIKQKRKECGKSW